MRRGSGAMENKRVIGLTFRLSSASLPYRIVGQSSAPDSTFSVPGNPLPSPTLLSKSAPPYSSKLCSSPLYRVVRLLYSVYLYKSPNHSLLSFSRMPVKKTNKNRKAKGLVRAFVLTRMSIAPRPMCSRVEIIPIDCLSLGVTPLIPEVTELSLSSLTKRDEVAMNQSTKPVT
ncbi:hypothetical protein COLO4_04297 [Corchorus olitorius]|uniref:Uncharacterized protein n=1 Tax=Corchorus olitorius TaxID=93759 RepID=A0A1R3KUH6_9ROSI|nr:hypothetical protein COLO4_04297 [Corchorus olitorius]